MQLTRPNKPDWLALGGIVLTAVMSLILQAEGPNFIFAAGACLFWAIFIGIRLRGNPNVLQEWGFRTANLWQTTAICLGLFVVIAGSFAAFALWRGHFQFPAHTWILLLLYPIWGLIQQFLALALAFRHFLLIPVLERKPWLLVLVGAALFGLAHLNDLRELAATFFLALVIIPLYLKYRNLWPLGVLHGWAGGLFYLWVLNRDLWAVYFH